MRDPYSSLSEQEEKLQKIETRVTDVVYLGPVTVKIRQCHYELASHGQHHSNYELLNNAAILGSN
jgi:hypothetical protein